MFESRWMSLVSFVQTSRQTILTPKILRLSVGEGKFCDEACLFLGCSSHFKEMSVQKKMGLGCLRRDWIASALCTYRSDTLRSEVTRHQSKLYMFGLQQMSQTVHPVRIAIWYPFRRSLTVDDVCRYPPHFCFWPIYAFPKRMISRAI